MATDFDAYLAPVLDVPAEAAQVAYPRNAGSSVWGLKRRLTGSPTERALARSNLLTVTADRVLIFPQHLAYGSGLTLEPAILDWPRAETRAAGRRRMHLSGEPGITEGQRNGEYVHVTLERAGESIEFELHSKGHQKILRLLGAKLTGKW